MACVNGFRSFGRIVVRCATVQPLPQQAAGLRSLHSHTLPFESTLRADLLAYEPAAAWTAAATASRFEAGVQRASPKATGRFAAIESLLAREMLGYDAARLV